jgi:hypothetical protein
MASFMRRLQIGAAESMRRCMVRVPFVSRGINARAAQVANQKDMAGVINALVGLETFAAGLGIAWSFVCHLFLIRCENGRETKANEKAGTEHKNK